MIKDDYNRIAKIADDYLALVRRTLTGTGDVPRYVLEKLKIDGGKVKGLLPVLAKHGASLYPNGEAGRRERLLKQQVEEAQIRVNLALDDKRTKLMQTVQSTLQNAAGIAAGTAGAALGAMAGAALFRMVADALRRTKQKQTNELARAVKTEMHEAKEGGKVSALMACPNGSETRVIKICAQNACQRCKAAYENPDGSPKIFTIGELRANGTNAGKSPGEWEAVVGCMHPYCQCRLEILP